MQTLSNIKLFGQATKQCINSQAVSQQDKKVLQDNQQIIKCSYYGTKVAIALGFITFIDWKKPMPIMKRQIPCAFLAFGLCALMDYATYRYAFGKTQNILVKYTGFRDGIYVNPDKFANMKKSYENSQGRVYKQDQNDLMQ